MNWDAVWTLFEVVVFAAIPVLFFWSQLRALRKLDEADAAETSKTAVDDDNKPAG
ncbi:MAG: hypothetical protein AAFO73_08695 [Pseudomonadota bacterium]